MKRWLRYVLQVTVGLLCLSFKWLPNFFGWAWLPGWPEFFSIIQFVVIYIPISIILRRPFFKEKKSQKSLRIEIASFTVMLVLFVAVAVWASFREVDSIEYLHSPNQINTAMVKNDIGLVYPVQAHLFYDRDTNNIALWPSKDVDWTYTWLDDNTLELDYTVLGIKDYIRW